ncbi:hypothetical protein ACFQ02_06585 [Seminibacterium arietis]|uniref:Pilus assembly protein PilP n=1 Tax=Seminibacterium arietis TaxID=1173502 RepID=A0ABW3IA09_9PAST
MKVINKSFNRWAILFILFNFSEGITFATDPFDKTQRYLKESMSTPQPTKKSTLSCHSTQLSIAHETPFEQIKFIGVLIGKNSTKIFFINNNQTVMSANEGDFIAKEKLKINKIELQQISLLSWQKARSCQQPEPINIKL